MKHTLVRVVLIVVEALVAQSVIAGSLLLVAGRSGMPLAWLAGTPFSDYTIPGLVLVIVVGGSALLAAATVFIYREWAVLVSAVAGLLLIGYLVVQAAMIDHLDWFYAACFVFGVAIFGLATSLWMVEYRSSHMHVRHGHPA
jgi:hypothetical protein